MTTRAYDRAKAWGELSERQRDQAAILARELKESGLITDHTHLLTVHAQTFVCRLSRAIQSDSQVGSEAVDWMVKTRRARDRQEATKFGHLLVLGNYIHATDTSAPFEDRPRLYKFDCSLISLLIS